MASLAKFELYLKLGFSPHLSADSSGNGHTYARHMTSDPRPDRGRSRAETFPRTLVAIAMVEAERNGGGRALAKGWIARNVNGNPRDCRESNLIAVPANGHRNSFRTVWNVKERWRLMLRGLEPNSVFKERRRIAKRNFCGANLERHTRADKRDASPRRPAKPPGDLIGPRIGDRVR
jgi:hypothetical protein